MSNLGQMTREVRCVCAGVLWLHMCAMCPSPTPPQPLPNPSPTPPQPLPIKWANSNNNSIGIHSVKVLVQVLYFILNMGTHRVPICTKCIRGPEGARKEKEITKWNRSKYVQVGALCPYACPEGAII